MPHVGHLDTDGLGAAKQAIELYLLSQSKGFQPPASSGRSKKYGCQGHRADGSGCRLEVFLTKSKDGAWNTSFVHLLHDNCASTMVANNRMIKELIASSVVKSSLQY